MCVYYLERSIMCKRTKLLVTALVAGFVCSFAAGSASANKSIEVRGGPAVKAEGRLIFVGTEEELNREVTCDVTLLRTITGNFPKIGGTQFGKITSILIDRGESSRSPHCRTGSAFRLTHDIALLNCSHSEAGAGILRWDCSRAPAGSWNLLYDSFQGTLPRIEGINFHIASSQFRLRLLEPFGGAVECLYEGSAFGLLVVSPIGAITRGRAVRGLTALIRNSGGVLCPARESFEGDILVKPTLTVALVDNTCLTPPTVVEQYRSRSREFTETLTVTINCEGTSITSIGTERPEVIGITDRERAIGRVFRRSQTFRYDLIGRDQPGEAEYIDQVAISTNAGGSTTRVTFMNT
jgi:hypothetical protein